MLGGTLCRSCWPMLWCATALLAGCGKGTGQSTLEPAGPAAEAIAWLWWVMCATFTAVFALVFILLLFALWHRKAADMHDNGKEAGIAPPLGSTGFIVAGGIVLPTVTLIPLLLVSLDSTRYLHPPEDALTIRVIGHMWWWEVIYPEEGITTANEIHIPAGKPIRLELESADVVHSFWVPRLNGKRDMIPGLTNEFWIHADQPGVFRGQCGEYCGLQHANMIFFVIALPPDEFRSWVRDQQAVLESVTAEEPVRGLKIFKSAGCSVCHAIHGTGAEGKAGPDLTRFGSRRTVAGMLTNTRGNLAGWIGDPQSLKPGVRMPRSYLQADELLEVTDYLKSLK